MDCDAISHSGSIQCNHDGQLFHNGSEMVTKVMSMKPWEHELRKAVAARSVENVLEILSEPGRSFSQKVLDDCLLDACGLYKERNQHLVRELLRAGASIKAVSEDGWTPILIAVKEGDFYLLCFFLQRGSADVNAVTAEGDSALTLSIRPNRSLVIINKLLQQSGIDKNHKNQRGYTALMKAVEAREIEAMKLLIDGHKRNNSKKLAISQESLDSDETIVNWFGQKLFDVAARTGMVKVIKLLLSVKKGEFPLIELALRGDVDINYRNKEGYTALMLAAQKLSGVSYLDALLLKGADVNIKDNIGNTALHLATDLKLTKNAKFLIEREGHQKVNLDDQNSAGSTALISAIKHGDKSIADLLIDRGANVNVEDYYGDTALTLSAWNRDLDTYKKIIERGADINHRNKEGFSALMIAVCCLHKGCIEALLNAGADVNIVLHGQEKKTAISLLFETKSSYDKSTAYSLMDSLLDRGASSSYLKPDALFDIIRSNQLSCISKLVSSGYGPAELSSEKYLQEPEERVAFPVVSPFMFALLYARPDIARFFDGSWFLSTSDIQLQAKHDLFQEVLVQNSNEECWDILEEFGSQPMSLLKLSFVAVSSAIGCVPGREETVKKLPLPPFIKDKLLFKK